jgi:hypothetical protein
MYKRTLCIFVFTFLLLFFPKSASADYDVVINEFYALGSSTQDPDWVEIYNKSNDSICLDGWVIRDNTDSNKIVLDDYICPKSFRKFNFSNRLNNSGDEIRLFDSEFLSNPIDQLTYFSPTIPSHSQNQSTGRTTDGGTSWFLITQPTPVDDNSCTPTPTPTPTPITNSTSTPTPKVSPTPTPKAANTPVPAKNSQKNSSNSSEVLAQETSNGSDNFALDLSGDSQDEGKVENEKSSNKIGAVFLILGGLLLFGAIGFRFWKAKNSKKVQTEP